MVGNLGYLLGAEMTQAGGCGLVYKKFRYALDLEYVCE
jgi:hypothetical protein